MYDNEFVFTRTANGLTFEQTVGPAFVPGAYAGDLGVTGDQCHDETVATKMFGLKTVSFGPSTSKAATEGSYNSIPYRGTTFEISAGGFMGQEWDGGDIAFTTELWKEVYRTLKPGGYLLSFSASRNYHRMAVAIEDSGFEFKYVNLDAALEELV